MAGENYELELLRDQIALLETRLEDADDFLRIVRDELDRTEPAFEGGTHYPVNLRLTGYQADQLRHITQETN